MISRKRLCLSMSRNLPQLEIDWCRSQQRDALEHMQPGHTCDHPQCCPENNERWLLDAFAEEIELLTCQANDPQ